ncbi:MAG: hypothetical protein ACO1RX_20670 [Candidatus Sericytochromatia bacterium]
MHDVGSSEAAAADQALLTAVMAQAGVEPAALEALVSAQQSALEQAKARITGTSFAIHAATRTLYIQDFLSEEVLATIPLFQATALFAGSDAPELPVHEWEPWGRALCSIHPQTGALDRFLTPDQDYLHGLVITAQTSFLFTRTPLQSEVLAQSNQCLYQRVHKPGDGHTAYDLYLSEDREYLCITDRHAGSLWVIATATHAVLGQVQIRPAGSTKALNVAFDYYEPRAFITDNQSAKLYGLHLPDVSLETLFVGEPEQVFGNLVRAPDIRYVYLLVLGPSAQLHSLNLENGEFEEHLALKGSFFSLQPLDPCDLMLLTPDQNHLLLITSHNEPTAFTPGISLLDPHQFQALRFHAIANALKEQTKPMGLVFPFANPVVKHQKSPLELLLAAKLITPEIIEQVRSQGTQRETAPARSREPVDLDGPDAPSEGQGPVPSLDPQAAAALSFDPKQALPAIVFALTQKLYQQSEIDLPAHPDELARFEALAEDYRQRLESHDAVEVLIEGILGRFTLDTLLSRQDILSLMARGSLRAEGVVRPPQACPSCNQPLKGNWDCPSCFLELESPQRLLKKQRASLDSLGALTRYQVLIADPLRKRLVILDDTKTIDWELKSPDLPCLAPWHSLWLPNKNLLVVDREASQVIECSPSGKLAWTLNQAKPELELRHPVKASYFSEDHDEHFLIVDQGNHRVLVVDRKQNLVWQYGETGVAGAEPGQLNSPSDLQRSFDGSYLIADTGNHRVIEVKEQDIVRSFGPEQGLQAPVFAQRLFDHDTLVVDSGNYRVIELAPDGQLVSECFYFTEEMGEEIRIDHPSRVYRREKKSILLMDEDKLLEIQPQKHRLIWSSLSEHLVRRIEIKRDAFDKSDSYVQSFYQYRIPTMAELIARLREENRFESASGIAQRIFDNLGQLVEAQRERDEQRARTAHTQQHHDGPLPLIPLYVIDRTNQQVVRLERDGSPAWHFGAQSEERLLRPTHLSETPTSLLIADTHHDRVIEVDLASQAVLQIIGGKRNRLSKPRSATRTLQGNTLIADQGNKRLVECDASGEIVWSFQENREISYPYYALELGKGTILYVDWALHVVKEITRSGELIWSYGQSSRMGSEANRLASPEYAMRLHSGAVLIADTGNHRILEVSPKRRILWEFGGTKKYTLFKPNYCQRFPNGHTLIAYNAYRNLLEIDREGEALWHFELGSDPLVSPIQGAGPKGLTR